MLPYEPIEQVTLCEYEVLKLMAEGHSNREIARELCKSEETVKSQLKAIYSKLQIRMDKFGSKRVQAIRKAYQLGLLPANK